MKNGSKFEAQYQPCLAEEPILSNPWRWQAGRVGKLSKTHFSNVPTVFVIRTPNKGQGWRFFLISQPTLQCRGEKGRVDCSSLLSLNRGEKNKNKKTWRGRLGQTQGATKGGRVMTVLKWSASFSKTWSRQKALQESTEHCPTSFLPERSTHQPRWKTSLKRRLVAKQSMQNHNHHHLAFNNYPECQSIYF